jgi:hypothetical protein
MRSLKVYVIASIAVVSLYSLTSTTSALPGRPYGYGKPLLSKTKNIKNTYQDALKRYVEIEPNTQLSSQEEKERLALLLNAIVRKDLGNVKKLIESGIDPQMLISLRDADSGLKTLNISGKDRKEIAIKGYDYNESIPLVYYAAIKGSPDILGYLLQKISGASIWNTADNNLVNLVRLVIKNSQEPGVLYKFLKDIPNEEREYYLKSLIKLYPKNLALISALLDRFKDTFNPDNLLAGAYPHTDTIKLLINKYGANVNAKTGGKGNPLLYRAVRDKKQQLVRELLALNADSNICNNLGERPIDVAAPGSHLERILKDAGASRDYKCEYMCYNRGSQGLYDDDEQAFDETVFQKLVRYATGQSNYKCS